jgi:hypothetical protein
MVDLFETPRVTLLCTAKNIRDRRLVQSAAFVQRSAIIRLTELARPAQPQALETSYPADTEPIVFAATHELKPAIALRCCTVLLFANLVALPPASAFGLVKVNKDLKHFPLQGSELSRLGMAAGWVEGEPNIMVFDVGNRLEQPVFCASVEVDLTTRGKQVRALTPSLYIPPAQSRRGRLTDVSKKDVRSFKLVCTCLRKSEKSPCEHPLTD